MTTKKNENIPPTFWAWKSAHIGVFFYTSDNFQIFTLGGQSRRKGGDLMVKKVYYQQNNGHLPATPPRYLGTLASACWRRIVPFLEDTGRVERIDIGLVEQYCANYEIYRNAYQDIQENGIQAKIFSSLQNSSGSIIGKDFTGFRKNPAVATMKDALNQLNSVGIQLGLSPKGRQELMSIASHKKEKSMAEQLKEAGIV